MHNYDHQIHISIKDDGKGFDISRSPQGNGLNNIKARAQEIKAEVNINSEKEKGESLDLVVKFT